MNDYKQNTLTWQCYMVMLVELECLRDRKHPNGQPYKQKDIDESNKRIADCTEVLQRFNCQLPTIQEQVGDQLSLFT